MTHVVKEVEGCDNVTEVEVFSKPGSKKGDGFLSNIEEVNITAMVNGHKKSYTWIVKSPPRDATMCITTAKCHADEREVFVYGKLFPALKQFAVEWRCPDIVPTVAEVHYAAYNDLDKCIVMEHLGHSEYAYAINKKAGLDFNHAQLVMKWLARFHALSHAYIDQYEGGLHQFKQDMPLFFNFANDTVLNIYNTSKDQSNTDHISLVKQVEETFNCPNKYLPKLQSIIAEHGSLDLYALQNSGLRNPAYWQDTSTFMAICHFDPWFNNMYFKYSPTQSVNDVCLFDFQTTTYLSVVVDINYFIFTSLTGQMRAEHLEELLSEYHSTLCSTAEQLGSPVSYTYQQLRQDLRRISAGGFNFAMLALPTVLNCSVSDVDKDVESKNSNKSSNMSEHVDKSMNMKQRIKDILDDAIEFGIL